jgi:hypothetical protein
MYKKKLLLLSYPLGYLGLFTFTQWVAGLFFTQEDSLLVRTLLVLGSLVTLVLIPILQDGSYLAKLIDCFPQEIRNKCQHYISYLDRVSLGLFLGLAVSFFLGESFYSHVSEVMFYFALGFYISSSAAILLFLSRK